MDLGGVAIEGKQAAARDELAATFMPTGAVLKTQVIDRLVSDDRCRATRLVQFVDTPLAQRVIDGAEG